MVYAKLIFNLVYAKMIFSWGNNWQFFEKNIDCFNSVHLVNIVAAGGLHIYVV